MEHMVEVHVVDQGRGLTDEQRAHAFDRFEGHKPISGRFHAKTLALKIHLREGNNRGFVVDEQDGFHRVSLLVE